MDSLRTQRAAGEETMPPYPSADDDEQQQHLVARLEGTLDEWRARLDLLRVQADLAEMGIRQSVERRLATAQNAWLAAESRLADARPGVDESIEAVRDGVEEALTAVKAAYAEASAVIRRQ